MDDWPLSLPVLGVVAYLRHRGHDPVRGTWGLDISIGPTCWRLVQAVQA